MIERNDKPLLMKGALVRKTIKGEKNETRRLLTGSKEHKGPYNPAYVEAHRYDDGWADICPHGKPGDLLWVRENFWQDSRDKRDCVYAATPDVCMDSSGKFTRPMCPDQTYPTAKEHERALEQNKFWSVKPSIHMPRKFSRLTLEIKKVKVERIQDITPESALAEGISQISKDGHLWKYGMADSDGYPGTDDTGWPWEEWMTDPVQAFRKLWDSINAPRGHGWDKNPWCWVITYKPHLMNIDEFLNKEAKYGRIT